MWNLHGSLHSQDHGHLSLHNNDRDVDEFVDELQLRNLNGFQHSQDDDHLSLHNNASQQLVKDLHLLNIHGVLYGQNQGSLSLHKQRQGCRRICR